MNKSNIELPWAEFKIQVLATNYFQWLYFDINSTYMIYASQGDFKILCKIAKDDGADQVDFEANYKPGADARIVENDDDGAQIVRIKAAKRGWSFWSVPIEIVTSTLGASLFCQNAAGVAIPWITAKIYDGNDAEITSAGVLNANLNTCVKTVIDVEPTFNFEVIGGALRINSNPSQDVRLWIVAAPDIPANLGGSKEFSSGVNLKFLAADNSWELDGRVTKAVAYDAVNHSGKIRILLKHPAGLQVNLMFVMEIYRQ